MPVIAEAAAEARLIARRGASAAAVLVGAGLHPVRTVKDGVSIVRGLVNPPDDAAQPAPTDVKPVPVSKAHPVEPSEDTAEEQRTAAARLDPEPPEAEAVADVPVEPQGPAPHIPPSIAHEVERDYGDDLPGMHAGGA